MKKPIKSPFYGSLIDLHFNRLIINLRDIVREFMVQKNMMGYPDPPLHPSPVVRPENAPPVRVMGLTGTFE